MVSRPPASAERQRRVHAKSRKGCGNCKVRRVKVSLVFGACLIEHADYISAMSCVHGARNACCLEWTVIMMVDRIRFRSRLRDHSRSDLGRRRRWSILMHQLVSMSYSHRSRHTQIHSQLRGQGSGLSPFLPRFLLSLCQPICPLQFAIRSRCHRPTCSPLRTVHGLPQSRFGTSQKPTLKYLPGFGIGLR
jgi:hypothetical protein